MPDSPEELVQRIRSTPDCRILEASGVPSAPPGLMVPDDVQAFYRLAGGAVLFETSDYRMDIVSPSDFQSANASLLGIAESGDISDGWFVVATCGSPADVVTVDLHPARLGRCYFSFPDVHAVAGSSDIVAMSFSALVTDVLDNEGGYWFWLNDRFEPLGDAYD